MGIFKYKVLNPVKNKRMPFFDKIKGIFYVPDIGSYRYFVEACVANQKEGGNDYFILLGKDKFDINCRICHTDNYSRTQIKPKGEFLDYILKEVVDRGNLNVEYIETIDNYDVFKID